jgi:RNA polymerase sigma-70 factor (ECF subfamily)
MELFERFACGDLDAFETLFHQYQAVIYSWILRIVRNRSTAEDLTVETFWRIYRAHARFDPRRPFEAWARRIATNVALHYMKRARSEMSLSENLIAKETNDPVNQKQIAAAIQRAFQDLPPKLRITAVLALIEERPYQEIAEALGISVPGVKTRIFRAVKSLRKKLKDLGIEP